MSIFSKIKLFGSINKEKPKDLSNIIETSDNSSRELTPEEIDLLNNVIVWRIKGGGLYGTSRRYCGA